MHDSIRRDLPVVVLGAGPAGLSAGVTLSRLGLQVVVVEKQGYVGGLGTTLQQGAYRVDLGPHAFHLHGDETDDLFREFCRDGYRDVPMKSALRLQGTSFEAPLKFGEAFLRLKPSVTFRMGWDYAAAQLRSLVKQVPEDSFEAWGVKRYGKTMYDLAFGNYSRKVWGIPTTKLHTKLAEQKLPNLSFWELLREALGGKGGKEKLKYTSYAYPVGGIGTVYEGMAATIRESGGRILLETTPRAFVCEENRIAAVDVAGKGAEERIPCSLVINTIPLSHFFKCCDGAVRPDVAEASGKLVYRDLIMTFIEVDKESATDEIMIYLLDDEFSFNRISEQKNIAPEMIPPERTMVGFEMCTDSNSDLWKGDDSDIVEAAKREAMKWGLGAPDEILGGTVVRIKDVYPMYDRDFDRRLSLALDALHEFENVYAIGRQGLFLNSDMHTSIRMGLEVGKHLERGGTREEWTAWARSELDWRLS